LVDDPSLRRLPLDPSAAPPHLAASIHDTLKREILAGRFRPSERINQEQVARELGVSRTPVREALHALAREGLVELHPRRGAFVSVFGESDVSEIYEMRELLEPHAAANACLRASPAQIEVVRRLTEEVERATASNMERAFSLNREFHQRLCEPCENRLLMALLEIVWSQQSALSIFAYQRQSAEAMRRTYAQHREIVAAYTARDPGRTRDLLRRHISEAHRVAIEMIAESHLPPAAA
jgi:DNA-binding GntR family transcriptional regulator